MLHQLQHTSGEGTDGLKAGLWLIPVILLNTFGAVAVIAVALYSAYKVWQRQAPGRFVAANVTIAVGTLIISAAGSTGRLGLTPHYFWIIMTAGWIVIFAGSCSRQARRAQRARQPRRPARPRSGSVAVRDGLHLTFR